MSVLNSTPTLLLPRLNTHKPISPTMKLNHGRIPIQNQQLQRDWPNLLQLSIASQDSTLGTTIHGFLLKSAPPIDPFVGNNLINMYSKFHRLDDARQVFDEMPVRNTISWTTLMSAYLITEDFESVLTTSQLMHQSGEKFSGHTCTIVLQACRTRQWLVVGEQVHGMSIKIGADSNIVVGTCLASMYARNGLGDDTESVFGEMNDIDARSFNSLILEYGKAGHAEKAIRTFGYMLECGLTPDDYTFTNTISACSGDEGKQLHGLAIKGGVIHELSVGNAVISMYGRHGFVEEAKRTFHGMIERSLVSWTAYLSACLRNGEVGSVVDGYKEMLHLGLGCDSNFLATVLDACSQTMNLALVSQVHCTVLKLGYLSDVFVGTAMVDAYAKCGRLDETRLVLDDLPNKNIASFNAILGGYKEANGSWDDTMILFNQMRLSGIEPDEVTITRLLRISAEHSSLDRGLSLQAYAIKAGMGEDVSVCNALITMYAKCGSIRDALHKFNEMAERDVITWNAMISAHALHGQGDEALLLFNGMIQKGIQADETTLVSVLQACIYSGQLEEGIQNFKSMKEKYNIKPQLEHQVCMVDLLGRHGDLGEAMEFIQGSEFKDSPLLWRTLVNVCKFRGDLDFGVLASRHLLDLASKDAASYILVSNMYSEAGWHEEAAKLRVMMQDGKLRKEVGCSWIEVNGRVHRFTATGKDHLRIREIYEALDQLTRDLKQSIDVPMTSILGYVPYSYHGSMLKAKC